MKIVIMIALLFSTMFAEVRLKSSTKILRDTIHGADNPKRIPQSRIRHTFLIDNDSPDKLENVVLRTDLDVRVLDISQSMLMVDKKYLLKSTSLNPNTGEIEIVFFTLAAYEKVRIMIDATLR